VYGLIANHSVVIVHLGTPCHSFSVARCPQLRSKSEPWGLSGLCAHERDVVLNANTLARASINIIMLCIRHKIPVTIEHPQTSRLWWLPFSRIAAERTASWSSIYDRSCEDVVSIANFDQCAFGSPRKKPTRVMGWNVCLHSLSDCVCNSAQSSQCVFSGRPHVVLRGIDPSTRAWRTSAAQQYPRALCKSLANVFTQAHRYRQGCKVAHIREAVLF
jgi:hypothetical protein